MACYFEIGRRRAWKSNRVQEVIESYEDKASEAKRHLQRCMRKESVAFLRVSASGITLYGEQFGYVGPVIYRDLGLHPHECKTVDAT